MKPFSLNEADTPVLLLDGAAADRNIARMAAFFADRSCRLRPHFKNHKCVSIARRQLAAGGAVGMTCAKLGEAEVLAEGGIGDILIANQVVGEAKARRAAELGGRVRLRVAADDAGPLQTLSAAATAAGVVIGILVEIDIGMGRCGVAPGEPALALARRVSDLPGLRFDGLQAYEGHAVYTVDAAERRQQTQAALQQAVATRRLLEAAGVPVAVVSGGSSATYAVAAATEGIDEVQAGTYVTMDWVYRQLVPEFETALSVLTTVISRPRPGVAVLDVGVKGVGHEFGPPRVRGCAEARVPTFASEEHCIVHQAPDWPVGARVELIPSHACTTANLHRALHVRDGDRIVDVWPIEASGRLT
ncbi:MAG: DSD1 family PLP-dependent enzyme [Phycisphaerae bacterium]|nr:DSD1 family PLP-dependent enzyme [Phycisphaerae bacterium]